MSADARGDARHSWKDLGGRSVLVHLGPRACDCRCPGAAVAPPAGWATIGDAESLVLPNGTFLLADSQTTKQATFNAQTLAWTAVGIGQNGINDEQGWTLLPNGTVLTVDANAGTGQYEILDPSTFTWTTQAGTTGASLIGPGSEIGPAVLLPDGRVFQVGGSANTAVYGTNKVWTPGPNMNGANGTPLEGGDTPGALLPNGRVLIAPGNGTGNKPTAGVFYFEFDGTNLNPVAATLNASSDLGVNHRMLVLPMGQILLTTDTTTDVEIYTPTQSPNAAWAPTISNVPGTITRGQAVVITGTQFNGLSLGASYGDEAQMSTNYPLVRVKSNSSGHVFYARTFNPSSMGVATGNTPVQVSFDLPSSAETGSSQLVVVANGIPSLPVAVTVQ